MSSTIARDISAEPGETAGITANSDMLKGIVRQHWHDKLDSMDKINGKALATEIDMHLANITAIIDPLDYEVFCVPNMIAHSKHMSRDEFSRYLRLMESMAYGYSSIFGSDIAGLALIGISSKAKNVSGVERYHRLLSAHVESKIKTYHGKIEKRKRHVDGLYLRMKMHERSILRFFRKGKISMLTKRIDYGIRRVESLNYKFDKFNGVYRNIKLKGGKD